VKLPRDVGGEDLTRLLATLGYETVRQTGSHISLSRQGQHHITVPRHRDLKIGTLSAIVGDVADHLNMTRDEVIRALWG